MITWNSLKTQNFLSSEFWVPGYDFLPCTYSSGVKDVSEVLTRFLK